jgi:protein KTI12
MPLITLCGFPCSGKTQFATMLASHIEKSDLQMKCLIINEEALHMSKPEHYKSASQEKILRQNLKSAVEHALNSETIVIFDSCNYIKGYRYELYCIARSQRTPHCVVHVSVERAIADQWNSDNIESLVYDTTL